MLKITFMSLDMNMSYNTQHVDSLLIPRWKCHAVIIFFPSQLGDILI